ncbi:sensor histidine kinase [Cellulomonas sp. Root137]|uniref:sensor histidine kinase n=1 Tax=Cellulomonas sp. Root137 TaxID=1736459 RepID=UPI0006FAA824|nr:ATP-binding protein [Cellulomonas sp. Root137]KQY45992.1 histidine kinase [Cellulomonas sp. Root137]
MTTSSSDSAAAIATRRGDSRRDQITLLRGTAIIALGYGVGAALQSAYVYAEYVPEWAYVSVWARLAANSTAVIVLVLVLAAVQAHRATRVWWMVAFVTLAAALAAAARFIVQVALGVHSDVADPARDAEVLSGFILGAISGGIGMWAMATRRSARIRTRSATRNAVHVEVAIKALEQEEIRVRRAVAEGLHGTLQSKLVLVDARLADVISRGTNHGLDVDDIDSLAWVRSELDEARETDVREMSRLLYPDRLELGLVPALRALLGRIPASIATRLTVSDAVRALDDPTASALTVSERLLAVRVVEEALTNALKHGPASSLAVELDVTDGVLHVSVENDGELYDPTVAGTPSGTARLGTRLTLVGGRLALSPGSEKGARLQAWLPLGAGGQ